MTKPKSSVSFTPDTKPPAPSPSPSADLPRKLYTHADPLLRRLRMRLPGAREPLENLEGEFRDAQVLVLYFGSGWGRSYSALKEFHADLHNAAEKYRHKLKVVYVSTDADLASYEVMTANRPWMSMEFSDGSDFLLPGTSATTASPPPQLVELARGEDFLTASDGDDDDDDNDDDDVSGQAYVRPYSRAYIAQRMGVLSTPTVVVYHIPTRKILSHNARKTLFRPTNLKETMAAWERGEGAGLKLKELYLNMRWTFVLAFLALVYALGIQAGLIDNILPVLIAKLGRGGLESALVQAPAHNVPLPNGPAVP